jgi:hypothetical protein
MAVRRRVDILPTEDGGIKILISFASAFCGLKGLENIDDMSRQLTALAVNCRLL